MIEFPCFLIIAVSELHRIKNCLHVQSLLQQKIATTAAS